MCQRRRMCGTYTTLCDKLKKKKKFLKEQERWQKNKNKNHLWWDRFHDVSLLGHWLTITRTLSPWYNHTGWLGVKYQLTYLLTRTLKKMIARELLQQN